MPDELIELRASEYQDLWPSCSYGIVTWCSNYHRGIIQYPQNIIKMHTCTVDMAITVQYHEDRSTGTAFPILNKKKKMKHELYVMLHLERMKCTGIAS